MNRRGFLVIFHVNVDIIIKKSVDKFDVENYNYSVKRRT